MNAYRHTPALTRDAGISRLGRNLLCAFVACTLTVVLWGEVGKSAAQAAQRAIAEQNDDVRSGAIDKDRDARPVERRAPLI